MTGIVTLILTTLPNAEAAGELARKVLDARVAACVTRLAPAHSQYFWHGSLETADEVPLLFKTAPSRAADLERMIASHHPYDVPEILIWEVGAAAPYADWVERETRKTLHV